MDTRLLRDREGAHDRRFTLRVPGSYGCRRVDVAGDFTAWVPIDVPVGEDGCFRVDLLLPPRGRWRYRLLLDDVTWTNDLEADDYELAGSGGAVSIRYS